MSETYPFSIPSGTNIIQQGSGTSSLGSTSNPFGNLFVNNISGSNGVSVNGSVTNSDGVFMGNIMVTHPVTNIYSDAPVLWRIEADGNDSWIPNNIASIVDNNLTTVTSNVSISNNPLLTSLSLPLLTSVSGTVSIGLNSLLPNAGLSFTGLTTIGKGLIMQGNNSATFINFPNLATTSSLDVNNGIQITSSPTLTGINFSSLISTTSLNISSLDVLTSINFPSLTKISGLAGGGINFNSNLLTTSMNFPALVSMASFLVQNMNALTGISFPSLTTMISGGAFTAQANSSLTDVNISGLVNASGSQFEINNNSSLATITINSGINATYFHFNTNALSQASVDQILLNLDTAGYSSGSLFLNGGTSSSPTSGTSNANYLSLIGKSWSVNIN